MGRYLGSIDWSLMFASSGSGDEIWNTVHTIVHTGLDLIMPKRQIRVCNADAPWMNHKLKSLIVKRQQAFISINWVNSILFKYYWNLVNRERKICRPRGPFIIYDWGWADKKRGWVMRYF
jgi:hypothetical protein